MLLNLSVKASQNWQFTVAPLLSTSPNPAIIPSNGASSSRIAPPEDPYDRQNGAGFVGGPLTLCLETVQAAQIDGDRLCQPACAKLCGSARSHRSSTRPCHWVGVVMMMGAVKSVLMGLMAAGTGMEGHMGGHIEGPIEGQRKAYALGSPVCANEVQ